MSLLYQIGRKPIIAAVRNPADTGYALNSNVDNLFFMGGNVKEVIYAVQLAKQAGKGTFIHVDLVRGLSSTDKETVGFIADYIGADGIVTPKSHMIKEAKKIGLYGILHLFVLDSLAYDNGLKIVESVLPDGIELMPGVIPKVIRRYAESLDTVPIIASGLIQTREEASHSIEAGATALSVSDRDLWRLTFQDIGV